MRTVVITASVVSIPLSLWCFDLANHAVFPSGWLRHLLGPQERAEHTSAPDYMEWDVATMMLMLAVCAASTIYLVSQVAFSMRRGARR
jgi:hypothetical protein